MKLIVFWSCWLNKQNLISVPWQCELFIRFWRQSWRFILHFCISTPYKSFDKWDDGSPLGEIYYKTLIKLKQLVRVCLIKGILKFKMLITQKNKVTKMKTKYTHHKKNYKLFYCFKISLFFILENFEGIFTFLILDCRGQHVLNEMKLM